MKMAMLIGIPEKWMKKRKAHTVLLSTEAQRILSKIKKTNGEREYIFPAQRNPITHTNNQTLQIKRVGYAGKLVVSVV